MLKLFVKPSGRRASQCKWGFPGEGAGKWGNRRRCVSRAVSYRESSNMIEAYSEAYWLYPIINGRFGWTNDLCGIILIIIGY